MFSGGYRITDNQRLHEHLAQSACMANKAGKKKYTAGINEKAGTISGPGSFSNDKR